MTIAKLECLILSCFVFRCHATFSAFIPFFYILILVVNVWFYLTVRVDSQRLSLWMCGCGKRNSKTWCILSIITIGRCNAPTPQKPSPMKMIRVSIRYLDSHRLYYLQKHHSQQLYTHTQGSQVNTNRLYTLLFISPYLTLAL